MTDYLGEKPSLEDYWRGIILFGQNVASYKFALAKSLLELAPKGKSVIPLEQLAEPFSRHITEHLKIVDKQTTSSSSRFLNACRQFNAGEISQDRLINTTVRLGFENVIDAFHYVNAGDIPKRFFTDERRSQHKGIILTDELLQLLESPQFQNFLVEVEARWRLVETAWQLKISRNLISVNYDSDGKLLFAQSSDRRINITSCRDALNGYQRGKCFYCFASISIEPGTDVDNLADVDHLLPHMLKYYALGSLVDGVWNLVLACQSCNRGKSGKFHQLPHLRYLKRLYIRNEYLIGSHHPLRETLIQQTGNTPQKREQFLKNHYKDAETGPLINTSWQPLIEYPGSFGEENL
ncbi:HNH endonuclease domain-containing protein [Coleofasciculus sp. FACHB-501]|uniref:HNH endonuclease domain-containing protein n=1 Tax=Cyanophyceae TaxID=3028117 RepID=UPI00168452D0|nr:HNH endonuclease domain-containing protein [Coleofasciculus sp. FACHB-501]MBD1836643.1 HNH endonuclease [Coleofasciculus sp. FACHB-501]